MHENTWTYMKIYNLFEFMLIYMRFEMLIKAFHVFELGVPNQRACGASPTSKKTRPWNFGPCTLCILLFVVAFSLVCPISVPAALRWPQKNTPLGFWTMCPMYFVIFFVFLAWCAQSACLRRFADLRKNTPLEFWTVYPMYFVNFCVVFAEFWCFECYIRLSLHKMKW